MIKIHLDKKKNHKNSITNIINCINPIVTYLLNFIKPNN
jgi:hypothetical protein